MKKFTDIYIISFLLLLPIFFAGFYSDDFADQYLVLYNEFWIFAVNQWFDMGTFRPITWFIKYYVGFYDNQIFFRIFTILLTFGYVYFFSLIVKYLFNYKYQLLFIFLSISQVKYYIMTDSGLDLHNTYQLMLFFISIQSYLFLKYLISKRSIYLNLSLIFMVLSNLIMESFILFGLIYISSYLIHKYLIDTKNFKLKSLLDRNLILLLLVFLILFLINSVFRFYLISEISQRQHDSIYKVDSNFFNIIKSYFYYILIALKLPEFKSFRVEGSSLQVVYNVSLSLLLFLSVFFFYIKNNFFFSKKLSQIKQIDINSSPKIYYLILSFGILLLSPVLISLSSKYQVQNISSELYYPYFGVILGINLITIYFFHKIKNIFKLICLIYFLISSVIIYSNNIKIIDFRNKDFHYPPQMLISILEHPSTINFFNLTSVDKLKSKTEKEFIKKQNELLPFAFKTNKDFYDPLVSSKYLKINYEISDKIDRYLDYSCDKIKCYFTYTEKNFIDSNNKKYAYLAVKHRQLEYQNFNIFNLNYNHVLSTYNLSGRQTTKDETSYEMVYWSKFFYIFKFNIDDYDDINHIMVLN